MAELMSANHKACVVGSGPNGLAAGIVLAQAGLPVDVLEAESTPGGAVRSMELTLPGFLHDFGSSVYPMGAGSPFFSSLPLHQYGLDWIQSPATLAHPLDDGAAVVLERELSETESALGVDAAAWRRLVQPFAEHWSDFAEEILRPVRLLPRHPWLMAQFGLNAFFSARTIARRFATERTRALYAGLAAHSFLSLDETLSGAFGTIMAISTHAVGWPIVRGGAQSLTDALVKHLASLGGKVQTNARVNSLDELSDYAVILINLTPRQILQIAGSRLTEEYKRSLKRFRYGPGVYKVDYALSDPIPWRNRDCLRAATVHLGGSFEEIAAAEKSVRFGQPAEHPFVLVAQASLFDPARAPAGRHTAWTYCHVPNGSTADMLEKIENQLERFAPGFREVVLARRVFSPADIESMDANLVGGDIGGGIVDLRQFLFRPTRHGYATSDPNIYICSASAPPGGGVHGMCGYHAAKLALSRLR